MSNIYKVVYTGKLLVGVSHAVAIENVSQLLNLSQEKAEALIECDKAVVVKKDLNYDLARKYKIKLIQAGLQVKLLKSGVGKVNVGAAAKNSEKLQVSQPPRKVPSRVGNEQKALARKVESVLTGKKTEQSVTEVRFFKAWFINFIMALVVALVVGFALGFVLGLILIITGTDKGTASSITTIAGFPLGLFASFYFYKWSIKRYIFPQVINKSNV